MASLNMVFPQEACPTMAKLRISFAGSVVIWRIYDKTRRVKSLIFNFHGVANPLAGSGATGVRARHGRFACIGAGEGNRSLRP
jgi:hypothetical protein